MDTNYTKPGWKTTEFWTMIITAFFGILILTGTLTNTQSNDWLGYINSIMGSSVTLGSVISYIFSRGKAKQVGSIKYEQLLNDIKNIVNK